MTGDQQDMLQRLKARLPTWFDQGATDTPVLDALLSAPAWVFAQLYAIWAYANLQVRIATATDGWLDLISGDFFGLNLPRRQGQSDASYRALILAGVIRKRVTRAALRQLILDITGNEPIISEPKRLTDGHTVYGRANGYSLGFTYGSTMIPRELFLTVYRPEPGSQWDGLEDGDIYAAVNMVKPLGTTIWVRILDLP